MSRPVEVLERVVIRFAGDSGDGMQLAGDRFTQEAAALGNDLSTLPSFPAEIRAPAGTIPGVSSFQVHFANRDILTPGDEADVLVAMNPAALKANIGDVRRGGAVIVDTHAFTARNLTKAGYADDPLTDGSLASFQLHAIDLTAAAVAAVKGLELTRKDAARTRNMYALGLLSWLYGRPRRGTEEYLATRFAGKPVIRDANLAAFRAGWFFGETTENFAVTYRVDPAALPAGIYRNVTGSTALALGIAAAGDRCGLPVFLGAYPITPASDVLHELSHLKGLGVTTFQAEDEIAAAGAALGASFGGHLGVTTTSGPGLALKAETIGLAVMLELPLLVVDVQRGGPSTGLPTKTEQSDLLQAMFGRNGEAPVPVVAACTPSDCFETAVEAARIAITWRTPVILLSDGFIANGAEPWRFPDLESVPTIDPRFEPARSPQDEPFLPYLRDPQTMARPWAPPGTPGLAHRVGGLEKADRTGDISYEPANHDLMVRSRQAKVERVAQSIPPLAVDDPSGVAQVLVLGWGSTYGAIGAAVRRVRRRGADIAWAHLRHLNPFPPNLEQVLGSYDLVVVPELNLGQLALLLRSRTRTEVASVSKVRGEPFKAAELEGLLLDRLESVGCRPDAHPARADDPQEEIA